MYHQNDQHSVAVFLYYTNNYSALRDTAADKRRILSLTIRIDCDYSEVTEAITQDYDNKYIDEVRNKASNSLLHSKALLRGYTQALIRSMSNGKAGWMFSLPTVGYFTAAVFHTMSLAFLAGESLKEDIIVAKITSVLMDSQYNFWVKRLGCTHSFLIERI